MGNAGVGVVGFIYTPGSCKKSGYNLPDRRQAKEGSEKREQTVLLLRSINFSSIGGSLHEERRS